MLDSTKLWQNPQGECLQNWAYIQLFLTRGPLRVSWKISLHKAYRYTDLLSYKSLYNTPVCHLRCCCWSDSRNDVPPEAQRYVTIAIRQGAVLPSSSSSIVADIIGFFLLDNTMLVAGQQREVSFKTALLRTTALGTLRYHVAGSPRGIATLAPWCGDSCPSSARVVISEFATWFSRLIKTLTWGHSDLTQRLLEGECLSHGLISKFLL